MFLAVTTPFFTSATLALEVDQTLDAVTSFPLKEAVRVFVSPFDIWREDSEMVN